MQQRVIFLVLLFGVLCGSPAGLVSAVDSAEYILVEEYKSWSEAADYCGQKYIDLASAQTAGDWSRLTALLAAYYQSEAWVGLYDDVDSWRWSYLEERLTFTQWDFDQPNNLNGQQYCVSLRDTGFWWDEDCNVTCAFICQNHEGSPVLVADPQTSWNRAQEYCRLNYRDLMTVRSPAVNQQLIDMIQPNPCAWIGLFRDSWKWSDQTAINPDSPLPWAAGQPDNSGGQDYCAALNSAGQITDERCSRRYYFFCQTTGWKQQILRLQVKAGDNVNDQAISAAVLNKVQQKLKQQGMAADVKLSWRERSDGGVFQKMKNGSTGLNDEL